VRRDAALSSNPLSRFFVGWCQASAGVPSYLRDHGK